MCNINTLYVKGSFVLCGHNYSLIINLYVTKCLYFTSNHPLFFHRNLCFNLIYYSLKEIKSFNIKYVYLKTSLNEIYILHLL